MVHKASIAWKVALALLLGAAVVFAAPVMGAHAWAADDNPMAGLKEAKVAFDITAGDPGRMLNILNTIDETREGFAKHGVTPHFVLAFRGPATLLTETDLLRLKPEDRETAIKIAAKLKQLRGSAGIERLDVNFHLAGFEACDVALQTHGGYGYAKEFHVERLWREVRLYKIAPVSQQMTLNYVSEHVLGLPKSY